MQDEESLKKVIARIIIGTVIVIVIALIVRTIRLNIKKNQEPQSEIASEEILVDSEETERLASVLHQIATDTIPYSMKIDCNGHMNYMTSNQYATYQILMENNNTMQDNWIKMDSVADAKIGIKGEDDQTKISNTETSYMEVYEDKNRIYTYDGSTDWFYTDMPFDNTAEIPSIEDIKPLAEYLLLHKTSSSNNNSLVTYVFQIETREQEFVTIANNQAISTLCETIFPVFIKYDTTVNVTLKFDTSKTEEDADYLVSYAVGSDDKTVSEAMLKDWGIYNKNATLSNCSMIISLSAPAQSSFDIPKEVKAAISEQEWMDKDNKEIPSEERHSEEEPSEEDSEKKPIEEEPSEPASEEVEEETSEIERPELDNPDSVYKYIKTCFDKTLEDMRKYQEDKEKEKETEDDEESDEPLTLEEIREIYGKELMKLLEESQKDKK